MWDGALKPGKGECRGSTGQFSPTLDNTRPHPTRRTPIRTPPRIGPDAGARQGRSARLSPPALADQPPVGVVAVLSRAREHDESSARAALAFLHEPGPTAEATLAVCGVWGEVSLAPQNPSLRLEFRPSPSFAGASALRAPAPASEPSVIAGVLCAAAS